MMKMLFYATVFIAFSHMKDAIFLFANWKNSLVLNDFVRTVDVVFIPFICAFFLEAICPGRITNRQLGFVVGFQSSFILLFLLFPVEPVALAAMAVAFLMALATIAYVLYVSINFRRYISTTHSYVENIDVMWVTASCVVYFCSLFFYSIAFENTTWLSEAMYNLFSIVFWTFLVILSRRHKIVKAFFFKKNTDKADKSGDRSGEADRSDEVDKPDETTDKADDKAVVEPQKSKAVEEHSFSSKDEIAEKLKRHMERSKSYLDPCVTLNEIAQAIGTNRTYLSDYFNNTLNITFYDYINTFRIADACRIIEAMPEEGKKTMEEVSRLSGFNSKSTFHRYFVKIKGVSPKQYALARRDSNRNKEENT